MNVAIDMYKALITLQSKFWNVNSELLDQIYLRSYFCYDVAQVLP